MKKILPLILVTLVCGLCFGCTPKYTVNVDGVTAGQYITAAANCIIVPAGPNVGNDLTFNEYRAYVADALTQKGYNVVASRAQASTIVVMNYGMGNPLETIRNAPSASIGFGTSYWDWGGWGRGWGWGFAPAFYFPLDDVYSYTTYGCFLYLEAYDVSQSPTNTGKRPLWQINVGLRSTSSDLRAMMPILVTAAMPYIGDDTGQQISVDVSLDDAYVQRLQSLKQTERGGGRIDYTAPQ